MLSIFVNDVQAQNMIEEWDRLYVLLGSKTVMDKEIQDDLTRMIVLEFELREAGYRLADDGRRWYQRGCEN